LMRRASPERPKGSLPARSEVNPTRDSKNRNKGKKARRKNLTRRATDEVTRKEEAVDPASGKERQVASNLAHNPEAKGRGLAEEDQQKKDQATELPATSGGECSRQKEPEYS
jgi:hypothetical protein